MALAKPGTVSSPMAESDDSVSQFGGEDDDRGLRPPPSVAGYQQHPYSPESAVDDFEQGAREQEFPDDQSDTPSWARGANQPSEAGGSAEGQSEAPNGANAGDDGSVRDDPRALRMGLNEMPGFRSDIMGDNIKPVPAKYMTGLPGYWAQWSNSSSPFKSGCEPRPARVLCHNIVGEFIAKDAARIGEWETLSDQSARARQVSSAALLGMLTTGTAKGWTCTDEHTELTEAREDNKEGEELDRIKKSLNGNVKTYTYRPHKDDPSKKPEEREMSAMQFGWFLEELYSPDKTKVVAIRIFKLIYCSTHSDDQLWGNLMQETSEITRAGNINAIPEALRKPKLMQQNKLQRSQINDEDLENTASTQWKRIDSMSALTKHLLHYAGAGDSSRGRPLYADMANETPAGCIDRPLREDKKRIRWGGSHPLGPSVALNFKRYVESDTVRPGHPGVNVAIAGTIDASGNKIKILPVQCNPNNYFDPDGTFRPPDEVVELGAMWACHDNSVKNIFNVPFPRPVHGSVVPDDVLLKSFFDLRKNDDKVLRRTQECDPPKEFEQARDATEMAFNSYVTERDAVAAAVSKSILNSEMLAYDSIDKTVAEQERLDRRAYETRNVDKVGNVWVLEPRQALRDISLEIERAFSMVDDYDKRARLDIASIQCQNPAERRQAIATRQRLRQTLHCQQVEACIRLGLRRFEHAFSSKKLSGTIPPGWKDICDKGLRKALKEAAEVGIRLSKLGRGRKVNPDDINCKHGTANVAFGHDQGMVRKDLTPWGHWRCFLTHMMSAGIKVQGDQIRLMLEAWLHSFEPCAAIHSNPLQYTCMS